MKRPRILNKNKLTEEEKEELRNKLKENPPEKGDLLAIIIAAFINLLPVFLLVLGMFMLVIWLIFLR
jgi:cell division septal protein FtsQ